MLERLGVSKMLSLLFLVFAAGNIACDVAVPIVETTLGQVSGVYEKNDDGEHFLYMGIPYGRVRPENIFGDALEALPWEGVWEANDETVRCPQREEFNNTIVGSMDCLKLNIYRPAVPTTEDPLPVYFFVYGGAFSHGFASRYQWGPERLTVHDVIVVTINYRTGIFGLMCLDTADVPGNAGYKDLILGLNWVQENIAAFGGDPNRVTVGGSSSGAFAVEWLVASPLSEGLFHRLLLESGSATSLNWIGSDSKVYVLDVAEELGFEGDLTIDNAWRYLNNQSLEDILVATETLGISYEGCVEKEFPGVKRLAIGDPKDLLPNGIHVPVDVLTGFNSAEGLVSLVVAGISDSYFESVLQGFVFEDDAEKERAKHLIRRFYIGDEVVSEDLQMQLVNMYSDALFVYPSYRSAHYYALSGTVYLYQFAYAGDHNFLKKRNGVNTPDASHADEIGYTFRQDNMWAELGVGYNATDQIISDYTTTMFMNFVKYGNPTPEITENTPVIWEPIDRNITNYLLINTELELKQEPFQDRMAFWELLYYTFYEKAVKK